MPLGRLQRQRRVSSVEMDLLYGTDDLARSLRAPAPMRPGRPAKVPWKQIRTWLNDRHDDLHRHFVFEYYPWYGTGPWRHWTQWSRNPPVDVAAMSMPRLGPYSSIDTAVIEQHARWIVDTGGGAINYSWWGRGSYEDAAVNTVMDIMGDHGLKVAFHLEPYDDGRGLLYATDLQYLLREYGDRRGWDHFLVLRDADGSEGPVFKSFRTIVPQRVTDCHGVERDVSDYTPDDEWQRQTDTAREQLRREFDHITLLADSMNVKRLSASGFDGWGVYDNFIEPTTWADHVARANEYGLKFSFNCNPGYDSIERRVVPPESCYEPDPFHPPASLDFSAAADRERARRLSQRQIRDTLATTLQLQTDPANVNAQNGFFLVYINSFNEWHEGHQFEPSANWDDLSPEEQAVGYHNPRQGGYRLQTLKRRLEKVLK